MTETVGTLHRVVEAGVIEDHRVAIDGGAGRGSWTALMAVHFNRVLAFEPDAECFEYVAGVIAGYDNVEARQQPVAEKSADGVAIDDLELDFCGLIRLSVGGAELLALRGAFKTIRRCRPVLVVSVCGKASRYGHSDRMIQGHLIAEGYRELFRAGPDRVFVPD